MVECIGWNNMDEIIKLMILTISVLFFMPFIVVTLVNMIFYPEEGYVNKGEIIDFDVSAGGFLSSSRCKIVTENITTSCYGCGSLEVGKCLYKNKDHCRIRSCESE